MDNGSRERDLVRRALEALQPLGIDGRVVAWQRPGHADMGNDAVVELRRSERSARFGVVVKQVIRPSTLAPTVDQLRAKGSWGTVMLVSELISPETAELLTGRGIPFIDSAGNAHIDTPDLLVLVTGRRLERPPPTKARDRIGPATLQVMFAILRDADAARLPVRALGERAGVSHGAAATALQTFDKRGWLRHAGREGYRLVDPDGMLSAWVHGFADQLSPKLEIARATHPGAESPSTWAKTVSSSFSPERGLLGGEVAAEVSGQSIRGGTASVYVRSWDAATMRHLRLAPSPDGAIVVRSAFSPAMDDPNDHRLVDPLVVLGEVASIPDERLDDTRAALRSAVSARFQP
jgi:hypothetical protein